MSETVGVVLPQYDNRPQIPGGLVLGEAGGGGQKGTGWPRNWDQPGAFSPGPSRANSVGAWFPKEPCGLTSVPFLG